MNGKTLGPFGLAQLQGFRDKGRLRPDHELSVDRERWFSASRVPELYPPQESPATYNLGRDEPSPASSAEGEWYVEIDGERRGPLSLAKLRSLIAAEKVAEDDLVWRSGLGDWQPAEDFPELFVRNGQQGGRSMPRRRSLDESGVWPRVLEAIRQSVSEEDLERICRSMLSVGRVSMIVGALGVGGYLACAAITRNELATGGFALLSAFMLLALQYVGHRMGRAAHHLASASSYRLSSTAFPYTVAVILLASGVFMASVGILLQIERSGLRSQYDSSRSDVISIVISCVVGIEFFLPFLYAFHAALHPSWSNVDCNADVCAGEEGIGCVAYILKMGLRFVPIIYGVSALLGALGSIVAVALYAAGGAFRRDSYDVLFASLTSLVAAAVVPLVWYLQAALISAILDFLAPSVRSSSAHTHQKA